MGAPDYTSGDVILNKGDEKTARGAAKARGGGGAGATCFRCLVAVALFGAVAVAFCLGAGVDFSDAHQQIGEQLGGLIGSESAHEHEHTPCTLRALRQRC